MRIFSHLDEQQHRGAFTVLNAIVNPKEDAPHEDKDGLLGNIAVALAAHIDQQEYPCFLELAAFLHGALAAMPAVKD